MQWNPGKSNKKIIKKILPETEVSWSHDIPRMNMYLSSAVRIWKV